MVDFNDTTRRELLQSSVKGIGTMGMVGLSTANSEVGEAKASAQIDTGSIEETLDIYQNRLGNDLGVERHAQRLFEKFDRKHGISSRFESSGFEFDEVVDVEGYCQSDKSTTVTMVSKSGEMTPMVLSSISDTESKLVFVSFPEFNEFQGILNEGSRHEMLGIGDSGEVTTQACGSNCIVGSVCHETFDGGSFKPCEQYIYCCTGGNCCWGDIIDCACSDPQSYHCSCCDFCSYCDDDDDVCG